MVLWSIFERVVAGLKARNVITQETKRLRNEWDLEASG